MAEKRVIIMVGIVFALWLSPIADAQVTDAQEGCTFALIIFINFQLVFFNGRIMCV